MATAVSPGDLRVHTLKIAILRLQRCMDDMEWHIAEERAVLVVTDEFDGMLLVRSGGLQLLYGLAA